MEFQLSRFPGRDRLAIPNTNTYQLSRPDKFGRPKVVFDRKKALAMRRRGLSIRAIAAKLGVGKGAVERLVQAETAVPKP